MLDLAATIRTAAAPPAWLALPQQHKQAGAALVIRGNVLVVPLMACQTRRTSNLLGAVILAQQRPDSRPVRRIDPGALARLVASLSRSCMRWIRRVPRGASVAIEIATNRAGTTTHLLADRSQAQARFAQLLRLLSFRLGQVTSGHGQLHLQVEELRLRQLAHYAP
jgi:hypothetical protein